MKKLVLAAAVAAACSAQLALAEDAAPPPPDNVISYNVGLASDYRYRGISQTREQPALQGGADYTNNPTGFYLGTWLSTIKWTKDAGGGGDVEWDLYGGKRGNITDSLTYDVGVLSYVYPGNDLAPIVGFANANTTEVYGQLGFGPAYIKYSHSVTNLFGYVDSKNSGYLDVGANIDVTHGFTLNLHGGHQKVANNSAADYNDWKLGVTKDFGFMTGALAVIGTDADKIVYANPVNGKFMGKSTVVLTLTKTF